MGKALNREASEKETVACGRGSPSSLCPGHPAGRSGSRGWDQGIHGCSSAQERLLLL